MIQKLINMDEPEYSIEVYKDHAIIKGWLTSDILKLLINLCKKHGFTHLVPNDGGGFKLVRKEDG
jgi:hypothetical protein